MLDELAVTREQARRSGGQRKLRTARQLLGAEALEPALEPPLGSVADDVGRAGPEQVARALDVAALDRVGDGALAVAVLAVPGARAAVERRLHPRLAASQLSMQRLREQAVVAVLAVAPVERHEHQVGPGELLEELPRIVAPEHEVAERSGQAVEYRGAGEEGCLIA